MHVPLFSAKQRRRFDLTICCFWGSNMVWLNWQHQKVKHLLNPPALSLRQPFYILTITLLSLLPPLSFLLLSRFSNARYYLLSLEVDSFPSSQLSSFLLSFLPSVLYLLVSIISTTTLVHSLTGKVTITSESPKPILRPRLYIAWTFICTLQVCVGLGIEGSIAAGINDCSSSTVGMERSLLSRLIFFLGLHETMLHWSRVVVRPVVDDTFFGVATEERWAERAAMATSFGTLWCWKLRNEVEYLVAVAEFKGSEVVDFVAWGLYYLTVTIGMIKIVKGFMWLGMLLLCRRAVIRGELT